LITGPVETERHPRMIPSVPGTSVRGSFKWCFILSLPRSGSTLLTVLLDGSGQCLVLPETHFLVFQREQTKRARAQDLPGLIDAWLAFYRTKKWIGDLPRLRAHLLEHAADLLGIFTESVLFYMAENGMEPREGLLVVEKSTPHMYFQQEIAALFPEASAIYLVRDPRAIVASLSGISWSTHNVYTISRVWNRFVKDIGRMERSMVLRYESLVDGTDRELRALHAFLGLRYDGGGRAGEGSVLRSKIGMDKAIHQEIAKPVNRDNVEKWRSMLSATDLETEMVEHLCKEGMVHHAYGRVGSGGRRMALRLFILLDAMKLLVNKLLVK